MQKPMERKDRQTLKGYFKKGNVPTEEEFATLIDSVPNIAEDGQAERTADGWAFYPKQGGTLRLTLHGAQGKPSAWTVLLAKGNTLTVENARGETVMQLGQDKTVSLPGWEEKEGEGGTDPAPQPGESVEVEADGQWHDILTVESGETGIYELTLLLHDADKGIVKETRATAACLSSVERLLTSPKKHWWGWSGSMKLRWLERDKKVFLQARSKRDREAGVIYCKVR